MKRRILGISWLNEKFTASWLGLDGARVSWTSPEPVVDGPAFATAVREARQRAPGRVCRANVAIDHRSLLFHVQEAPPAKGRLLTRMLDRLVDENRFYDEPAVWTRVELPPNQRRCRWLLCLIPKSLWTEIESACEENDLELRGLYPATALLGDSLRKVGAGSGEVVLIVADFEGSHGLMIGQGNSQILFARSVAGGEGDVGERLVREIDRTMHFARQRFGAQVNRLVASGGACYSTLSGRKVREGLNVECLLSENDGGGFAVGAAELRETTPLNFMEGRRRQAPWLRPALVAAMSVLLAVSLGTAGWVRLELNARIRDRAQRSQAQRDAARLDAESQRSRTEADRHEAFLRTIGTPEDPSVAATFARYLGARLPTSLRLTALALERKTNGWWVQIEGATRERGSRFLADVGSLEAELTGGLFQMRITDGTEARSVGGLPNLASPNPAPDDTTDTSSETTEEARERAFFVTGTIQ
ncbi:MAG: hypothetical protein AB7J34_17955 [Limisphaerales bacterium]